jgi:SecD/SecF fusion protein
MMLLLAIMMSVGARLTLTGLAGLALTVAMAVDNNVLVYERLREEIERGATLRMGIRNAFQRASATIIDANLTTLIAAVVLYVIGRDQLKGFAVALGLGVAISIFTSVFVSRVLFDIAEKKRVLTEAKMLRVIGVTKIDFMGLFRYTATASLLITIGGLIVAGIRGQSLFDIDFTGGVSVQALFKEPQDIADVREKLQDELPDVAVTSVKAKDDKEGKHGVRFNVNTSEQDQGKVTQVLNDKFSNMLVTNFLEFVEKPTLIAAPAPPAEPEKGKEDKKTEDKKTEEKTREAVPEEKGDSQPADKTPAEKPVEKTGGQSRRDLPSSALLAMSGTSPFLFAEPDEKAGEKTVEKTEEKPVEKTDEKPATAKTEEKPVEKTAAEPAAKTEEKPVEKTAETPATKTEEKPTSKTEEEPATKTEEEPATKTEEKPTSKTEEKPAVAKTDEQAAPPDPFAGGTQAHLKLAFGVNHKTLSDWFSKAIKECGLPEDARIELSNKEYTQGSAKKYTEWKFRTDLPPDKAEAVFAHLKSYLQSTPFFPASGKTSGQVADNTKVRAVWAMVLSWACMIVYLWVRFQNVAFGLAAVVALIHDVFVMVGAIALSYYMAPYLGFLGIAPFKINMAIVAAILTIIGFSVNDTIVIFDRIREVRGKDPRITREMVNDSTNQTLSRTLLTSFTVVLVIVILYCFGGEDLHGMAFALLVGVVTGTYSSIYVAAPILLWLIGRKAKKTHGQIV